jgi:hypothetical protein
VQQLDRRRVIPRRAVLAAVVLTTGAGFAPASASATTQPASAPSETGATSRQAKFRQPIVPVAGPTPEVLAAAIEQIRGSAPSDFWSMADAAVLPLDALWDVAQGGYVAPSRTSSRGVLRVRTNAEMLLVHAHAARAGHQGTSQRPDRIEPLVRLLTGRMYMATLDGKVTKPFRDGRSVTAHAPGFSDAGGNTSTMHQSLDAVVMRALAAAWMVRDQVGLSQEARLLIDDRVKAVALSPFWRFPSRLLNQINWNADVYSAYTTVTGDPTLMRNDYRQQLVWLAERARKQAYPGGTTNFGSGLGFHYVPNRSASQINQVDTSEYANITLGALAHLDQAGSVGMAPLPASVHTTLQQWMRRVVYGTWTESGYLNWDSGKGIDRIHLTQYWLLALRGFGTAMEGSKRSGLLSDQQPVARQLAAQAMKLYRRRALEHGSVILQASSFGFSGSALISESFDGTTGTARFASTASELALLGLEPRGNRKSAPMPNAYSHDESLGRLAVTTSRYATAVVRPWSPLRTGGIEPSRIIDAAGRAVTGLGGATDGTLALSLRSGGSDILTTQPGRYREPQSALRVPKGVVDRSATMRAPLKVTASDAALDLRLDLGHRFDEKAIVTRYALDNRRKTSVHAVMRVPTYGSRISGSLKVGQRKSRATLQRGLQITSPDGARFTVRFAGLPKSARGLVVKGTAQIGNPDPGPELLIKFELPKKRTAIRRTLIVAKAR